MSIKNISPMRIAQTVVCVSIYLLAISIAGIMTMWVASDIFTGSPFISLMALLKITGGLLLALSLVAYVHQNLKSCPLKTQRA